MLLIKNHLFFYLRTYSSRNNQGSGKVELLGLRNSMIKYIETISSWQIETQQTTNTTAISEAAFSSFALGSHNWTISNDNKTCSTKGESYSRRLKLTGCREGEFTCSDGQCIKMDERCDQIIHCKDNSDEKNCVLLLFKEEESYNKKVAPFTINKDKTKDPVKVNVSTSLMNVLAISERDHTIDLKLGITLKWYEYRVRYHNLKTEEALNILSDEEVMFGNGKIEMPLT